MKIDTTALLADDLTNSLKQLADLVQMQHKQLVALERRLSALEAANPPKWIECPSCRGAGHHMHPTLPNEYQPCVRCEGTRRIRSSP